MGEKSETGGGKRGALRTRWKLLLIAVPVLLILLAGLFYMNLKTETRRYAEKIHIDKQFISLVVRTAQTMTLFRTRREVPPRLCADLLASLSKVAPMRPDQKYAIFFRPDCALNPRSGGMNFWEVFPEGNDEPPRVDENGFLLYFIGREGEKYDVWTLSSEGRLGHLSDPEDNAYSQMLFR